MPANPHTSGDESTSWPELVLAAAMFIALFTWLNRDWIARATTSVALTSPNGLADGQLIVWVLHWIAHSLRTDPSSIWDAPINYPEPAQLTGSEHFGTAQLAYFPLEAFTGNPLQAANYTAIVTYPLTAFATYVMVRSLGARPLAAAFAGFSLALGPMQVPGNLHILQLLPLFYPLCALSLHRLRRRPHPGNAALFFTAYLAGLFSSFYTASLLTVFVAVWTCVEIWRPGDRWRFALLGGAAAAAAIVVFGIAAKPYFLRSGEAAATAHVLYVPLPRALQHLRNLLSGDPQGVAIASTILSVLGLSAWRHSRFRAYVFGTCALVAIGCAVTLGIFQHLALADIPGPAGSLASLAGRFFRIFPRGFILVGFAFAVLGALGLENAGLRWPRLGPLLCILAITCVLAGRGPLLARPVIRDVTAFTTQKAALREVRRIVHASPGGSLVELPRRLQRKTYDARAMANQIVHGIPIITGHTGYLPAKRQRVDELLGQPYERAVLDSLIDLTELRWILVQPKGSPLRPQERKIVLGQLDRSNAVTARHQIDDLLLLEIAPSESRDSLHP